MTEEGNVAPGSDIWIILYLNSFRAPNHNNVSIIIVFGPGVEATQFANCCLGHQSLMMFTPRGLGLGSYTQRFKILCNTSNFCHNGFQKEWVYRGGIMETLAQQQW